MPISYQEALQIIQTQIQPLHVNQTLPLLKAINRISSSDVYAKFALPKHPMSLKEGYGIAFELHTMTYTLLNPPYPTPIPLGYGVRLSTGESIPEGADTIIAEEDVLLDQNECIKIPLHVSQSQHIKKEGEDIAKGELLLKKYERISAQKITALSAQGIAKVQAVQKPTVSILSIGSQLASGEIHNSNAMSLAARVVELGGKVGEIVICEEDDATILKALQEFVGKADCVITTGALSRHDAMRHLLETKALQPLFHQVRITPAKPSALTLFENTPILHLPGLPLGCMLGFEMLGVPLLRHLQHRPCIIPDFITCINQKRLTCKDNSMSAIPGYSDGRHFVCAPYYEAGRLNILSQCNGYTLSEGKESIEEGEEIPFFYFTHPPVS
ncbi:molybdopterin molybdotransferase MoeA [Sulfurospirillum halorespirans]|uniref:Molybdopterin molybdenumtransferase n=1 Tax=Sulfurospirillum halorespirans DSM 13726 TaxID=1193502 RepID=A0A1D7TG55_9BACT|nr:molybdopterin molybdotransferase MoeA [Sulfurospirillum halorespirans]AOO64002.1 molybdopterin molybdenumtransferase MoeA [Sulfurospirillum halorespirans DSM 13726]